jgi:hypothetical protein
MARAFFFKDNSWHSKNKGPELAQIVVLLLSAEKDPSIKTETTKQNEDDKTLSKGIGRVTA